MTEQQNVETAEKTEVVNPLARQIDLTVSVAEANALAEKSLRQYAKNVKMPGFRKGHVPMDRVRGMYGMQAFEEAVNTLVGMAWQNAIKDTDLKIACPPNIDSKQVEDKDNIHFVAHFEVFPEVEVPSFADVELVRFVCPVTDAEVDKTIDVMRRQRAQYNVVDRAAQADDRVKVNFEGTKEGVAFEGGSAEGYTFVLGQGRMLPEFEEAVLGLKAGQDKTFDLTFPENYGMAELNGQKVQFKVELVEVAEPQYPAIDDEFAKSLGVVDGVERMREEIGANLKREVKARLEAKLKAETMEAAYKVATFPVPQSLVNMEAQSLARQMVNDLTARGMDPKMLPEIPVSSFLDQADRRVRLGLLVDALIRQENITATDDEVKQIAQDIAASYENPAEVVEYIMGDKERVESIRSQATETNVSEWILNHAKTREEQVDFDKLMSGEI